MNFSKDNKFVIANTSAEGVAAATDLEGATLDTSGFEEVTILVTFGAITSGAVTTIKAQEGDESDLSDAADLLGTSQTIAVASAQKTFYINIFKPLKRYLRLYTDRATQNAVVASATYILSQPKLAVVTQGTNVSGELHVSPIAGTA